MARIFICYRREDASGHAGRLRDGLSARFGSDEVFLDHEAIGPGENFVQAMSGAIGSCEVFLAIIGKQWLSVTGRNGARRLDGPDDHVRCEIVEALGRSVRLIPILVEGAEMPRAAELPEPLKPLALRNAFALNDEEWESDVERLVAVIQPGAPVRGASTRRSRWPVVLAVAAAVLLGALLGILFTRGAGSPQQTGGDPTTGASSAAGGSAAVPVPIDPGRATMRFGEVICELRSALVSRYANTATLTVRVHVRNGGRYPMNLWDRNFRLVLGDSARAPVGGLNEVLDGGTTRDAEVVFDLPPDAREVVLRATFGDAVAEVPLRIQ
jgi:hypothetical protein